MNIKENLKQAVQLLKQANIEDSFVIARMLLAYTLQVKKEYLITHDLQEIVAVQEQQYSCYLKRIVEGTPLQYITKQQEFMKLEFYVNKEVLIPRADTEILVEEAIKIAKKQEQAKVLDLCTGSGAIGISIAKYVKESEVVLADISKKALQIAKRNAKKNQVEEQIQIVETDLFTNISSSFDIIVSNPPYIKTEEIKSLAKDVQSQPILALDGGTDGLEFYKKIIQEAYHYLKPNGYLCLEIGYEQKEQVIQLLEEVKQYKEIRGKKDLGGNDRIVIARVR